MAKSERKLYLQVGDLHCKVKLLRMLINARVQVQNDSGYDASCFLNIAHTTGTTHSIRLAAASLAISQHRSVIT